MTFEQLVTEPHHLLLKCISGSRAYNLHLPSSDTDVKGIFVMPQRALYGLEQVAQVANDTNDEVYFEIGRFIDLLSKNNPNILELLSTPKKCVLFSHPLMMLIKPADFLSRLCKDTFAGYARNQIKKARGLNKKIYRPMEKERKGVLEFCFVVYENKSVPLIQWLTMQGYRQEECGITQLSHFRDAYLIYHQSQLPANDRLKGIVSGDTANDVQLSAVPKGINALVVMHFNKDAYAVYCREYNEYWEWVEKRNEARFQNTLSHGKHYDAKNMMHTFRLLAMAEEIALEHRVIVYRNDREFLSRIRSGEFQFEELLRMAEEKLERIEELYKRSYLPEAPDLGKAAALLVQIRESFYVR
ncbi:nucleotidyltransferase domain-containing protein [uncultured Chitinophaga sp.]|jgi:Predicted nucleotidyltransferase|uniref:DNA polymerase beta superfamily protein n=1 Tax=uncultured Chitinophaga sp. TaxID=339340 RepID=UPI002630D2EB|nr:nucleotidyltransferase domain-containing protein [uncultured Chitinophaga sp.]